MNTRSVFVSIVISVCGVLLSLIATRTTAAQSVGPDSSWETREITKTVALGPDAVNGAVLSAWFDYGDCGFGSGHDGWPSAFSTIIYRGSVVATQTHILTANSWVRGMAAVDDWGAPDTWTIQWGSGSGLNMNYPAPGLPLYWDLIQEATDKATGARLLYQTKRYLCPTVSAPAVITVGVPVAVAVNDANTNWYRLSVGGMVMSNTTGIFTPVFTQTGVFTLTASAHSLGAVATHAVTMTVINTPPVADAGPDQVVSPGTAVTLAGSGSDPDTGQEVTFRWFQTGGTAVLLGNPNSATPSFVAPSARTVLTFTLVTTDPYGMSSQTDDMVVTVDNRVYLPMVRRSAPPATVTIMGIPYQDGATGFRVFVHVPDDAEVVVAWTSEGTGLLKLGTEPYEGYIMCTGEPGNFAESCEWHLNVQDGMDAELVAWFIGNGTLPFTVYQDNAVISRTSLTLPPAGCAGLDIQTQGLEPFPQTFTIIASQCDHTRYGMFVQVPADTVISTVNPPTRWRGYPVEIRSGSRVSFTADTPQRCTAFVFVETDRIFGIPVVGGFYRPIQLRVPDC